MTYNVLMGTLNSTHSLTHVEFGGGCWVCC